MNPPTTLTNHNPPATIGCGLNPNPIRREESDTPHMLQSWAKKSRLLGLRRSTQRETVHPPACTGVSAMIV